MTDNQGRKLLRSTELFGATLFVFAAGFPPFDDATEVDLTLHMLQHVLIIFAGVLIAYPHIGRKLAGESKGKLLPYLAFLLSAVIIVFWHIPVPWDDAVLNPLIHFIEHFSFLLVGLLAGSWLLLLSDSGKIGALMSAFFGHMGYAVALVSPWNVQIYSLYSLSDQALLGWILLLTGPTLVIGVAYVIARNPDWLGGLSGNQKIGGNRRETFVNRVKVPKGAAPALSISMATVLLLYFAFSIMAAGSAPSNKAGTTVYIMETPISWQYSPDNLVVVAGVNSTVTWVSHSISYDTVTDNRGAFGSGAIPPGGSFTFTFKLPGVYHYRCLYHPWMTGTITVLSPTA
jgi:plastocyanin